MVALLERAEELQSSRPTMPPQDVQRAYNTLFDGLTDMSEGNILRWAAKINKGNHKGKGK